MKVLGNDIKQIDKNILQKYQIDFIDKETIYKKLNVVSMISLLTRRAELHGLASGNLFRLIQYIDGTTIENLSYKFIY